MKNLLGESEHISESLVPERQLLHKQVAIAVVDDKPVLPPSSSHAKGMDTDGHFISLSDD
jgi:hypothetical protein